MRRGGCLGAKSREKSEYMSALGQKEDMRAIKKRSEKLRRTHFDTTYVLVGLATVVTPEVPTGKRIFHIEMKRRLTS